MMKAYNIKLDSFVLHKNKWDSNDLIKVCAMLNTEGGEICYIANNDSKYFDRLGKLITKKIKKIEPSTDNYIFISTGVESDCNYIKVTITKASTPCCVLTGKGNKSYYYCYNKIISKTSEEAIKQFWSKGVSKKSISKITPNMIIPDTMYANSYEFSSGNVVPIFEVTSVYGFNRIVGYLKYINRTYANVYSRGECKLHKSLIPSLYRGKTDPRNEDKKVTAIVNKFFADSKLLDSLSLDVIDKETSRNRIEGVLQHYGASTSFLDVVDNHWIALWMGLNKYETRQQTDKYAEYKERAIPFIDKISGNTEYEDKDKWEESIYQYILLIAIPIAEIPSHDGISKTKDFIEIDLRKSLPSTFLRPHAQHGLVVKKNTTNANPKIEDFDISTNVVGIVKIRIDRAKRWIGNGDLLTQDNLIPPPGYDPGYDLLLSKYDIFRHSSLKITKYM